MLRFHALSASALLFACGTCPAQTFEVLSPLESGSSAEAFGVSPNGRYACGFSAKLNAGDARAVRWNPEGIPMQISSPSPLFALARAVSDDGLVLAGEWESQAVIWGITPILLGEGSACDLDASGAVAVGYLFLPGGLLASFAYRDQTVIDLPPFPGDSECSALGVDSTGRFAVGWTFRHEEGLDTWRACVWDLTGAPPTLLNPLGASLNENAEDVSADGRFIVGSSTADAGVTAVLWSDGLPQDLTPGDRFSGAHGISDDGKVVVGGAGFGAFVWNARHGARSIRDILSHSGIDMSNVALDLARRVSADGRTIVGTGHSIDTAVALAWRATLADCPADFDGNGQADFFDYLDFVLAFSNDAPSADFNSDGEIDFFDYLDFVSAFDAGCA